MDRLCYSMRFFPLYSDGIYATIKKIGRLSVKIGVISFYIGRLSLENIVSKKYEKRRDPSAFVFVCADALAPEWRF